MTKARTASEKRKAKRGRPKMDGIREPNGRLSRSGNEPIDKLAIETRIRQLGVSADQAKDQKAGSFIGYLNLLGPTDGLSDAQYEGAQQFLRLREAYKRCVKSPDALYDPEARGGGGEDPEAYSKWVKSVIAQYEAVRTAIQAEQNYSRDNLWAALQYVVIEDQHLHGMIGATRVVCNVLARVFKTGVENRVAA